MARQRRWRSRTAAESPVARAARHLSAEPSRGVLLGDHDADGLRELVAAAPQATVLLPPPGERARHLFLTANGPFDFVVDASDAAGRQRRFGQTFFQLRPGGLYVIPGGAVEMGPEPGPLGLLLREAMQAPPLPLRTRGHRLGVSRLRALRDHVRVDTDGDDLLLTHDLLDVHVKLSEDEYDELVAAQPSPHRLLVVRPPAAPQLPDVRELPVPRDKHAGLPVEPVELRLREYRDVIVGPQQLVLDQRLVLPDSYRHPRQDPLRSNALVDVARHFAVPFEPLPADPPRLEGTYLHLDNEVRGHFGHLMTETVSRTWSWPEARAVDPDVRVLLCATPKRPRLLGYELALLEACGIPREAIVVIDAPARVDRLLSGTPMFSNPHFVHAGIAETWNSAGDRLAALATDRSWPRRLFLGRRENKRRCLNAAELEAEFTRRGFEVVHPEDHPLGDQVRMFRDAEVVAGYAGSGMFQLAFVPEPKPVIQITSDAYNPRNEVLIAAVRRHRLDLVVCRSEDQAAKGTRTDYRYDPEREGPVIARLLDDLAGPTDLPSSPGP